MERALSQQGVNSGIGRLVRDTLEADEVDEVVLTHL
jgi:hypothetical protein